MSRKRCSDRLKTEEEFSPLEDGCDCLYFVGFPHYVSNAFGTVIICTITKRFVCEIAIYSTTEWNISGLIFLESLYRIVRVHLPDQPVGVAVKWSHFL
jgi:hypothetical protein